MKMLRRGIGVSTIGLILALAILGASSSCDYAKKAAVANNKYLVTLQAFQQAVFVEHKNGRIDDAKERLIISKIDPAADTGKNLDTAIGIAARGGDITIYIDAAQAAFDGVAQTYDPNNQNLQLAYNAASAALKNAITLIEQLKASAGAPAKPTPAKAGKTSDNRQPHMPLAFWFMSMGVMGMAVSGESLVKLLNEIITLEPVAFNFVANLVTSLKGKTTDEVLALNEQLADQIKAADAAELQSLDAKIPPKQ